MFAKIVFFSDYDFTENEEELLKIEYRYSYGAKIEETFYRNIDDEDSIAEFEFAKTIIRIPSYNTLLTLREEALKKGEDTTEYDSAIAYEKAIAENNIVDYYNSMDDHIVRDGKIYITCNLINGKYDFIRTPFEDMKFKMLSKNDITEKGILKDLDYKSIVDGTVLMINTTNDFVVERPTLDDEDDIWEDEALEYIKSLDNNLYAFVFAYHF